MNLAKTFVLLTIEEFRANLRYKRRYLFSTMTTFASNLIVMAGIILVSMPSVTYGDDVKTVLQLSNAGRLIGFIYFFLGMSALGLPEGIVSNSRQIGTIDNMALSPLGICGVIAAQFLPTYVDILINVFVSAVILSLAFSLPVVWNIGPVIANSLIASVGMLGLGFIFGGLTIKSKQLGMLKNLLFILLFVLGIMPMGLKSSMVTPAGCVLIGYVSDGGTRVCVDLGNNQN